MLNYFRIMFVVVSLVEDAGMAGFPFPSFFIFYFFQFIYLLGINIFSLQSTGHNLGFPRHGNRMPRIIAFQSN